MSLIGGFGSRDFLFFRSGNGGEGGGDGVVWQEGLLGGWLEQARHVHCLCWVSVGEELGVWLLGEYMERVGWVFGCWVRIGKGLLGVVS